MRILLEESAGLIVDMQERLFPHIHDHQQLAKKSTTLIRGLQALDIPLLMTEQYPKGLGPTIGEIGNLVRDIPTIEKMSFSCCGNEDFDAALARTKKQNVILLGIEAHVCVLQTAIDLQERGYQPVVVADCTSSRNPQDKQYALQRMRQSGMIVTTCESILFELCRVAGTPQFKEISNLVK